MNAVRVRQIGAATAIGNAAVHNRANSVRVAPGPSEAAVAARNRTVRSGARIGNAK